MCPAARKADSSSVHGVLVRMVRLRVRQVGSFDGSLHGTLVAIRFGVLAGRIVFL